MSKHKKELKNKKKTQIAPIRRDLIMFDDPMFETTPFTMMRHFADYMENMMANFGVERRFPDFETDLFPFKEEEMLGKWNPQIEMFELDKKLFVRADLPGLKKEDLKVEITDKLLMIEGERKDEFEEKKEGVFRSERTYGKFYRRIPLPEGVDTKMAKATFTDGVLEISMAAPKMLAGTRELKINEPVRKTRKAAGGR